MLPMMRSNMIRLTARLLGSIRGAFTAAPDWSKIDSYSEIYRLIPTTRFRDQRAFVDGPLERYLQLVENRPGAAGARIMEHVVASLQSFRDVEVSKGRSTEWLDATAKALVRQRFPMSSDNGQYMMEVFEGRATHNFRASEGEEV